MIAAFALNCLAGPLSAQSTQKFYYWLTPRLGLPTTPPAARTSPPAPLQQGFVIEVDAATKAQIDNLLSQGHEVGVRGHIAAGAVDYNRNYYEPGHPVWHWYFTSVDSLRDFNEGPYDTTEVNPNRDSLPSDIEANPQQWIATYGDSYYPTRFSIYKQIDPTQRDALANVSNRGMAGAGEKTLITGFIVTGGVPRNVVVRALGPSLAASGVEQFASNPQISVFTGSGGKVTSNTDWKNDARANELSQSYASLAPMNDKEAALLLTLPPGNYTLQGTNEDGTEGVILLEVYDVDYQTQ